MRGSWPHVCTSVCEWEMGMGAFQSVSAPFTSTLFTRICVLVRWVRFSLVTIFILRRRTFVRFLSLCQIVCALLCVPHAHGDDDEKIYGSEMLFNAHKIITKIFVPIAYRAPESRVASADCHVVAHCCRSPKDALQIELFKSPSEICTRKFHRAVLSSIFPLDLINNLLEQVKRSAVVHLLPVSCNRRLIALVVATEHRAHREPTEITFNFNLTHKKLM